MKLGTRGRYAVMAVVDLAGQAQEAPTPLAEVSVRQGISLSYLEQIFNKLKRQDIVCSVRGASGGYQLRRAASEITVADVILSVDEPLHTTRCQPRSGKGCLSTGARCLVHGLWEALDANIYKYLNSITIEDVFLKRVGKIPAFDQPVSGELS